MLKCCRKAWRGWHYRTAYRLMRKAMRDPNGPQWSALQRRIDHHFTRAYELDQGMGKWPFGQ